MEKVKFGIIGLGSIADVHAEALAQCPNCELTACYSPSPDKADRFAQKYGLEPYTDSESFFNSSGIQAVSVATPSGCHLEAALGAIEKGKHIIVEKPLEITVERCRKIIDAANAKGVKLSGIFQSRFYDAPRLVKKAIDAGRFGTPVLGSAYVKWFRSQAYYDSGAWRGTWEIDGGGALMNQSIHAVDLLQWFMGPVTEIGAFTETLAHKRIAVEDTGAAVLKFANGALGVIEGTTGSYPGALKKIEITGTEGSAVIEEDMLKVWQFKDERKEDEEIRERFGKKSDSAGGASDPKAILSEGHAKQFCDFADAIIRDRKPFISGEDALCAVRIVTAIYESKRSRAFVKLDRPFDEY